MLGLLCVLLLQAVLLLVQTGGGLLQVRLSCLLRLYTQVKQSTISCRFWAWLVCSYWAYRLGAEGRA